MKITTNKQEIYHYIGDAFERSKYKYISIYKYTDGSQREVLFKGLVFDIGFYLNSFMIKSAINDGTLVFKLPKITRLEAKESCISISFKDSSCLKVKWD